MGRTRRARIRRRLIAVEGCCWHCGGELRGEFEIYATLDHLQPRAGGGTDSLGNLVLACSRCNRRKGDSVDCEGLACSREPGWGVFWYRPRRPR